MTDVRVPNPPTLSTVHGVELAQAGQWDISTGRMVLTRDDLNAAIAARDCPAVRRPVLKLGHVDPRFDGQPAVGYIGNMSTAQSGNTLLGDYVGMPSWLDRATLASAYPDRSIEAKWDFECQLGHTHPFVITAVALLGVTPPGIGTLESLQDVAELYGVAASAKDTGATFIIHAKGPTMPNPNPREVAAGVSVEDLRRQYNERAPMSQWICAIELDPLQLIVMDDEQEGLLRVPVTLSGGTATFGDPAPVVIEYVDKPAESMAASRVVYASKAESRIAGVEGRLDPPTPFELQVEQTLPPAQAIQRVHQAAVSQQEKGADMDSAKIKEALGLPPETTDDDVLAAIAASRKPTEAPKPEGTPPVPIAATGPVPEGAVVVDASIIKALQASAQRGEEAFKEIQKNRRDTVIAAAIEQGKFPPARRDHYELMWSGDPEGTEKHIDSLARNLVPLEASGYPGTETFEEDAIYAAMYPHKVNGKAATHG